MLGAHTYRSDLCNIIVEQVNAAYKLSGPVDRVSRRIGPPRPRCGSLTCSTLTATFTALPPVLNVLFGVLLACTIVYTMK